MSEEIETAFYRVAKAHNRSYTLAHRLARKFEEDLCDTLQMVFSYPPKLLLQKKGVGKKSLIIFNHLLVDHDINPFHWWGDYMPTWMASHLQSGYPCNYMRNSRWEIVEYAANPRPEKGEAGQRHVRISRACPGLWSVSYGGILIGKKLQGQYEPLPSNRSEEFKKEFYHDLEKAFSIGDEMVERIREESLDPESELAQEIREYAR